MIDDKHIIKRDAAETIYFLPLTDKTYIELLADISKIKNDESRAKFKKRYGFGIKDMLLDGDVKSISSMTLRKYMPHSFVKKPTGLGGETISSYKCYCIKGYDHSRPFRITKARPTPHDILHEDSKSCWNCFLSRYTDIKWGVIYKLINEL